MRSLPSPPLPVAPLALLADWDCCKPSCSWLGSVPSFMQPAAECARDGSALPRPTTWVEELGSACDASVADGAGGPAFACLDHVPRVAPLADDPTARTSYAFAATPGVDPRGTCGTCFELRFTGASGANGHVDTPADLGAARLGALGKTLIVQATNIGYDVNFGQFDVMIPGGGVGIFDACSAQWDTARRNVSLGAKYGGLLSACMSSVPAAATNLDARKACVHARCESLFGGRAELASTLAGCRWFADWFEAADNPQMLWKPVACPAAFVALSGDGFARDPALYMSNTTMPPHMPPPPASPRTHGGPASAASASSAVRGAVAAAAAAAPASAVVVLLVVLIVAALGAVGALCGRSGAPPWAHALLRLFSRARVHPGRPSKRSAARARDDKTRLSEGQRAAKQPAGSPADWDVLNPAAAAADRAEGDWEVLPHATATATAVATTREEEDLAERTTLRPKHALSDDLD